jgi:hypothetical protein
MAGSCNGVRLIRYGPVCLGNHRSYQLRGVASLMEGSICLVGSCSFSGEDWRSSEMVAVEPTVKSSSEEELRPHLVASNDSVRCAAILYKLRVRTLRRRRTTAGCVAGKEAPKFLRHDDA